MTHDDALRIIGLLSSMHWWIVFVGVVLLGFRIVPPFARALVETLDEINKRRIR